MLMQNDYKITQFGPGDAWGVDGRRLILPDCAPEFQPLRGLLKYHFRNSVLCNMKGRGPGYDWDDDITSGCDDVAEISNSEEGQLRFELEMAQRLNYLVS